MEGRFLAQSLLFGSRHSLGRKDEDRRNIGLKNLQPMVDSAPVGDDYAQWASALTPFGPGFLQFSGQAEPNVIAFQTSVPDQDRISQSALAKQMQLVFT
jgi:hypothetical protein